MARLGDMFGDGDTETFLGLPAVEDLQRLKARVAIVGADCATPYGSVGAYCWGGPAAIRAASADYASNLGHVNFDLGLPALPAGHGIVDVGDLPQDENDASANRSRIFGAVSRILDAGAVPVLIGGDDSVQIPMLESYGARERPIWILQIDAHIDWRDEVEGETLGLSSTMRRASEMDHVAGLVQVGQRGIGSARAEDYQDAVRHGVVMVPGGEVERNGVGRALDAIPEGADVVICLDLDGLDPSIMPSVIAPTAGGLGYWQVLELLGGVVERGRIAGMGLVELVPSRDPEGQGAVLAAQLLTTALGLISRQG